MGPGIAWIESQRIERAKLIEVRTSRTPDATRGALAVAGGPLGRFHVDFGHYDQIKIQLPGFVFTRLGPTWIRRSFSGMVRADGSGTVIQGNVDWEPGLDVLIAIRMAVFVVIIAAGLYGLTLTSAVNPIPCLVVVAFGVAGFGVLGLALLCRRQVQGGDEERVRAFFDDALK
jgi:hypothetical protein